MFKCFFLAAKMNNLEKNVKKSSGRFSFHAIYLFIYKETNKVKLDINIKFNAL